MVETLKRCGRTVGHIVDVGGGRGDLALIVASNFPSVKVCIFCACVTTGVSSYLIVFPLKVTVIDVNSPSLKEGQARAKQEGRTTSQAAGTSMFT